MSHEKAREHIESIEDLPTLPEVVIGITRLVEDPNATAEDIYRIVSTDPALSATMLKLVNSAFYGLSRQVTSLEKAIQILGFVTVRNIALAAFVFDAFLTGRGHFDYKAFWMRSIATGAAGKVLAHRLGLTDSGEYFVYGLLHDLGVIIQMQFLAEDLTRVEEMVAAGKALLKAEKKVMGCTHNELGAVLAEKWDFPPALVSVIAHHAARSFPEEFERETAVTTCAGAVAAALEIGESIDRKVHPVGKDVWASCGIHDDQLGTIMDEVLDELERSRSFIDLLYR